MAGDIPTSIPFLDAAYSPRPQQPDTSGASFMRAREQAEARREREAERTRQAPLDAIQLKVAEQTMAKNTLQLQEALRNRDLGIADTAAAPELLSKVSRAIASGIPSDPIFEQEIGGWLQKNTALLGQPKTTGYLSMWEKAKGAQKERDMLQLRHQNDMLELQMRNSLMTDRLTAVESLRQENRVELSKLNAGLKSQMELSLVDARKRKVTAGEWVNRWVGTVMRESGVDEPTAMRRLTYAYYSPGSPFVESPTPVAPPAPSAPATPTPDPLGLF